MGHDRDGQPGGPFADIFHLKPDGGLEFFPGFCRLLQASAAVRLAEPDGPIRERMYGAIVITTTPSKESQGAFV
jgi:hypothetical protein